MVRIEIQPRQDRGVITLRLLQDEPGPVDHVDLTPELLEQTFAHLMAAWIHMDKGGGVPGEPGTWTDTPAIAGAAWKVGARPLDGAITLGLSPTKIDNHELWLTYAFPRAQAEKLQVAIGQALARFPFRGQA